jgi:hypothetical protein
MVAAAFAAPARADPPNVPAVDAPQLAALGPFGVGVESLTLVQPRQPDVLAYDAVAATLPLHDRVLPVDVWYPAMPAANATPVSYDGALTGEDGKDAAFSPGPPASTVWKGFQHAHSAGLELRFAPAR